MSHHVSRCPGIVRQIHSGALAWRISLLARLDPLCREAGQHVKASLSWRMKTQRGKEREGGKCLYGGDGAFLWICSLGRERGSTLQESGKTEGPLNPESRLATWSTVANADGKTHLHSLLSYFSQGWLCYPKETTVLGLIVEKLTYIVSKIYLHTKEGGNFLD